MKICEALTEAVKIKHQWRITIKQMEENPVDEHERAAAVEAVMKNMGQYGELLDGLKAWAETLKELHEPVRNFAKKVVANQKKAGTLPKL